MFASLPELWRAWAVRLRLLVMHRQVRDDAVRVVEAALAGRCVVNSRLVSVPDGVLDTATLQLVPLPRWEPTQASRAYVPDALDPGLLCAGGLRPDLLPGDVATPGFDVLCSNAGTTADLEAVDRSRRAFGAAVQRLRRTSQLGVPAPPTVAARVFTRAMLEAEFHVELGAWEEAWDADGDLGGAVDALEAAVSQLHDAHRRLRLLYRAVSCGSTPVAEGRAAATDTKRTIRLLRLQQYLWMARIRLATGGGMGLPLHECSLCKRRLDVLATCGRLELGSAEEARAWVRQDAPSWPRLLSDNVMQL